MLRVILVRPGSTEFDEQRRIKGNLDIPLSDKGDQQVARTVGELANIAIDAIYAAPGQAAEQTARALAESRELKVKHLGKLQNLDHGLWHGKLIEEVKKNQPKVYRQWQERPETVCPPGGETLLSARERVAKAVLKLTRKHRQGVIAIVAPEPIASIVRNLLNESTLGDLWKAEADCGRWELIDVNQPRVPVGG